MFDQHVTAPTAHPYRKAEDDPPTRQGTLSIYDPPMETSSVETRTMPFRQPAMQSITIITSEAIERDLRFQESVNLA
jgi:hypothetical protein